MKQKLLDLGLASFKRPWRYLSQNRCLCRFTHNLARSFTMTWTKVIFSKIVGSSLEKKSECRLKIHEKIVFNRVTQNVRCEIYFSWFHSQFHRFGVKILEAVVQRCSVKMVFLKNSQNSQESTCARVSFLNKIAGLRSVTLLKKRLWQRCFPVNFKKF